MISFSKSAGEPDNAEPPIVGSASAMLISFRLTKENPQGREVPRGFVVQRKQSRVWRIVIEGKLIGVVIFGNGAGATFYNCDISAAL
jgi:hypothetical protein